MLPSFHPVRRTESSLLIAPAKTPKDASFYYTCGQGMERCGSIDATRDLRRDLYIDFWMNIYDLNTSIKRDLSSKIPDINIRQYDDGHISTMKILKSFSVSGQWCITGALVTLHSHHFTNCYRRFPSKLG
jgi:hypothetical protein